ncbi:amino acid adenylation domain-containing protein, partial [Chitinophaga eiseniae]
ESASQRAMQEQHRSYWKSVFADGVPLLHLPLDYKRPLIKDDKGGVVRFSLSREEVSALQALASRSQSTLFMVMLSLYNVLLSRVCNQDDIVVGTSVSGRYHADLEPLTGMFVNTLPLRHHPRGDQSFLSFLTTVRDHTLESFEHQSYPLEALIEDLSPERDTSRSPLFDVMFDYENIDMTMLAIPGLKVEPYLHEAYASKFDLTLTVSERGDDLQLYFEYAASLFNSSTVHRLITYFKNIVRAVIADNEVLLSAIVMLPEAEEELITQFNDTVYEGPGYLPVTALFRQQVVASPDAIALEYQGAAISYLELDRLSENVAAYLAAAGVGAGDLVGVLLDREPWLIAGILGVLKSGAAYVPVDTDYPANRTAAIFEAAGVKAIITRTAYSGEWNKGIILNLDEAAYLQQEPSSPRFETVPEGDSLAYVIYTSGSSGVPKGVMIRHRSLANYITWAVRRYVGEQPAVFGLHTSIAFDLTVTSLFAPLVSGNRLVLYDSTDSGAVLLEKVLHDNHCTILKMTPSHLKMLAEMNIADPNVLRTLIVGGEQLETRVAAAVHTQFGGLVKIYNEYGPTEATVGCMCYQYNPADDVLNVPIGYPIDNMQLYLLDRYQRAVPAGVEGEVYISGVGIAAGYHGRDDLNAGVFIPNPFCKGAVMYRSYDTAVYQAEYGLIYRGRRDTQIKLRGHRIEPEEIAAQLCRREDVSEAVILLKEAEKEPFLVCYYVAASPLSSTILRAYLRERLPDYMVPDFYVHLTALPLTVNGKLDESALPAHRLEEAAEQHRPVTQVQRELAQIWADVLGAEISQIGTQMNFFDLGGNSMKLLRMVNSINSHFRTTLQVSDIFRFPVIAAIAEHLRGQGDIAPDDADDGLQDMHTTLGILNQTGA